MPNQPGEYRLVRERLPFFGVQVRVCYIMRSHHEPLAVAPSGEDVNDCRRDYDEMSLAFTKPVIDLITGSGA